MAKTDDFDVCVIGTGASGDVMIDQLIAAGFRVVALQRGPQLQTSDFNDDELQNLWRNEVFAPDQVETWRLDDQSPTEPGRKQLLMCGNTWRCITTREGRIRRSATQHRWITKKLLTKCPELPDHFRTLKLPVYIDSWLFTLRLSLYKLRNIRDHLFVGQ